MWLDEDAPIRKQNLVFAKPFVNAAGTLGFTPDSHTMPFLEHLGAFITHPISRTPRQPAGNRCCLPFPGGFLLHTGLPNPGISRVISQNKASWAGAPLPVIVHLLVESPDTLAEMVRKLEGLENIMAVELGLPPDCDPALLPDILAASAGELPAILCLNPEQIPLFLQPLADLGPAALHLTGPRGTLPDEEGNLVTGRMYGPAVFPLMLKAARFLVETGLPVIGGGGIYEERQVDILREQGLLAIGVGPALWHIDPEKLF